MQKGIRLYHLLTNQFGIRATNGKALSVLHLHNHTAIEMALDLFQKIYIHYGGPMYTYECIGIHNLL